MISKPILLTALTGAGIGLGLGAVSVMPRLYSQKEPSAPPAVVEVQPYHSVSWFKANVAEMEKQLAACRDDPGHWKVAPYCANAADAARLYYAEKRDAEFRAEFPE